MADSASRDDSFIQKLTQIVLGNLTNEQFSVEDLADAYGISRSQMHKKLKKSKGKSVSQFVREIRLEAAMEMLHKDETSVSEIAYRVGFSSPTYFNTCFKEYYGFPPGEAHLRIYVAKEVTASSQPVEADEKKRYMVWFGVAIALLFGLGTAYFLFRNHGTPSEIMKTSVGKVKTPPEKSIAVLPLKNWSGDPELEYISDGMTEAIISRLSKISSIERVIPFTSVSTLKKSNKSMPELGSMLGVRYVLEGSFQLAGDQMKIKLQMVDAPADKQFWSTEYSGQWKSDDIFKIQVQVSENVAQNMDVALSEQDYKELIAVPTHNKKAYDFYLQAKFQARKANVEGFKNSIDLFNQAIEQDPEFLDVYLELATSWLFGGLIWGVFDEQYAWDNQKKVLEKAKAIDSTAKGIEIRNAIGYWYFDWNFSKIEHYYNTKYQGSEDLDDHYFMTDYTVKTGRYTVSVNASNILMKNDPTDYSLIPLKAQAMYFLGKFEECTEILRSHYHLANDNMDYLREAARWYYILGEYEDSRKLLEVMLKTFSERTPIIHWLGAVNGEITEDREAVAQHLAALHEQYIDKVSGSPAWFLALYYCHIEDREKAFEWLYKSLERHEVEMTWLREEPVLIPLRNDPRYLDIYKKVGFPQPPHNKAQQ